MTGQQRLWTPAVEAAHMSVIYSGHQGWSMSLRHRRQDETWGDRQGVFYGGLNTDELLDVACAELAVLLGFGDA